MTDPAALAPPRLVDTPLIVVTRFSYLGRSGWKSDASRDAALLFEPERLRLRTELFRTITLPSLAAQTDRSFTHVILTSAALPGWAMAELKEACTAAHGHGGPFVILARRPGMSALMLRRHLQSMAPVDGLVAQAVLDDDDGLAVDFVADVRRELAALDAAGRVLEPGQLVFVSFPSGYGFELGLDAEGRPTAGVYAHRYPFINLGLTLVGPPGGANVLGIQHRKTPLLHDPVVVAGKRMFLRSVHGMNDSRVARTGRWKPVDPWREDADIRARFPWLLDEGAFWNQG
jgi:Putative rhamnosyl transferase